MTAGKREKPFKLDMSFGESLARFAQTRPDEVQSSVQLGKPSSAMEPKQGEFQLVQYQTPECVADFTLDPTNETVWATEQQMATIFGVGVAAISKHVSNIYGEA